MELVGVRVELPDNTPVLLLREQGGRQRILPIMIGTPEASAIHFALEGVASPRPMTHDLFVDVLTALGVTLERVVVTEIREHTYFATLHLKTPSGMQEVSSRPSDAMALAARTHSPIFATDALLDEVGQDADSASAILVEGEEESILDEFRDFIENISPEDFSG
jgi:bifunctional DNase/RNase